MRLTCSITFSLHAGYLVAQTQQQRNNNLRFCVFCPHCLLIIRGLDRASGHVIIMCILAYAFLVVSCRRRNRRHCFY